MPIDVSRSLFIKNDAGEFVPVPMLKGEPGPAGPQGEPGSDANVTFENITNALGYVAADDANVQETADKLDALWKLSEGQVYDYVQQEEQGMNAAPKGTFAQYVDEVYGKSEQETTNGYQLIDNDATIGAGELIDGIVVSTIQDIQYPSVGIVPTKKISVKSGESLYFSCEIKCLSNDIPTTIVLRTNTISSGQQNIAYIERPNLDKNEFRKFKAKVTFLTDADTVIFFTQFYGANGTPYQIAIKNWMISRVDSPYEKYTGGTPMPNPDYPSEIHSVERVDIKVTGRNLVDAKAENLIQFVDPTGTNRWGFGLMLSAGTYSIHAYVGSAFAWHIDLDNRPLVNNRDVTFTLTQTKLMHVYTSATGIKANVVNDLLTTTIQLERGTTVTPYEPYHERTYTLMPPKPLNGIGEIHDTFDEDGWKYKIKEVAFNALSGWAYYSTRKHVFTVDFPDGVFRGNAVKANCMTNIFSVADWQSASFNDIWCAVYRYSGNVPKFGVCTSPSEDFASVVAFLDRYGNTTLIYETSTPYSEPMSAADIETISTLQELPADAVVTMLDQDGNDVSYLMTYMRKLSEVN